MCIQNFKALAALFPEIWGPKHATSLTYARIDSEKWHDPPPPPFNNFFLQKYFENWKKNYTFQLLNDIALHEIIFKKIWGGEAGFFFLFDEIKWSDPLYKPEGTVVLLKALLFPGCQRCCSDFCHIFHTWIKSTRVLNWRFLSYTDLL